MFQVVLDGSRWALIGYRRILGVSWVVLGWFWMVLEWS